MPVRFDARGAGVCIAPCGHGRSSHRDEGAEDQGSRFARRRDRQPKGEAREHDRHVAPHCQPHAGCCRSAGRICLSLTGTWGPATNMMTANPHFGQKCKGGFGRVHEIQPGSTDQQAGKKLADHHRDSPFYRQRQQRPHKCQEADQGKDRKRQGLSLLRHPLASSGYEVVSLRWSLRAG